MAPAFPGLSEVEGSPACWTSSRTPARILEMNTFRLRVAGLACAGLYAAFILWVYLNQPPTVAHVTGGLASSFGVYAIDQASFDEGLRLFRNDQFPEAREIFARADPAQRDARTQFYIAYSYYRQGWGRLSNDDELFRRGLETLGHAIAVAPGGRLVVDDPNLGLRSADELKAELEAGLHFDTSDLNPLRALRSRK